MYWEGMYRRFAALRSGKGPLPLRITHQESLAVAQVEPEGFEMTRAGRRFVLGNSAAITGIAPVQALVTTAAQWLLWNADAAATYFFEELGAYLTAGTPGVGGTLWAALVQAPAQVGSSEAGIGIRSTSNGTRNSKLIVKPSVTITSPAAPIWYPIASNPSPNVTAFASSTYLEHRHLRGGWAVPPGQGLALAIVAPAGTTPLFAPFAAFIEMDTDME